MDKLAVKDNKAGKLERYDELLYDIKSLLERAKYAAYKTVDNIRVQTYWQIGERIAREEFQHKERAEYGKRAIEMLAKDLGFARRLMFEVVQFYKTYPIVHALRAQLSWTHYGALLRIKDKNKREFYENRIIKNAWNTRELEKQVKFNLYCPTT